MTRQKGCCQRIRYKRVDDGGVTGDLAVTDSEGNRLLAVENRTAHAVASDVPQHVRLFVTFDVTGDLRFVSHHDVLRMFRRALARAGLPVRYSQGFNPHPKMTIPVPRPVGVASEAEAIVIRLDESVEPEAAAEALRSQMPTGLSITGARLLAEGERVVAIGATYRMPAASAVEDLTERMQQLLDRDVVEVTRCHPKTGRTRTMDVRPYIDAIDVADAWVTFKLRITGAGTVRPAEVAALLGQDVDAVAHRIRRTEIMWQQ